MKLSYQAFDRAGASVVGEVEAASADEAREQLRRRGLYVTRVGEEATAGAGVSAAAQRLSIPSPGKRLHRAMSLARQLRVLIGSGTRVLEALEAVERQTKDARWARVVGDLRQRVERGQSLGDAMSAHPASFDAIARTLVSAGESTGRLVEMLERVAMLLRKQIQLRNAVVGATLYPTLLVGVCLSVLVVMMLVVIPQFDAMFRSMRAPLPPSTKAVLAVSRWFVGYWAWFGGGALSAVVIGALWWRSGPGRHWREWLVVRVPVVGSVVRHVMSARLARLLGMLLESKVSVVDATRLVEQSFGHRAYASVMSRAREAVLGGEALSSVLSQSPLVHVAVSEAARSGEGTGELSGALVSVADFLDEENDALVKSVTTVLEPAILVGMGLLVGFMAVSMFLPLFDMTQVVGAK